MLAVVIAEGVAIALLAVLVLGLLRSHALILRALHELGAGLELEKDAAAGGAGRPPPGPVPVRADRAGRGARVPGRRRAGRPTSSGGPGGTPAHVELAGAGVGATLLAFLTSGCSVCLTFWEELGPAPRPRGDARLVVVAKGSAEESPATLARLARPRVEVVASSGPGSTTTSPARPTSCSSRTASSPARARPTTWPSVRDLLEQAVHETAPTPGPRAGAHGPGRRPPTALASADRAARRRGRHGAGGQPAAATT